MTVRPESEMQTEQFVITREFDAPQALVWQAFAQSDGLAQWWGPKGFTTAVLAFEFRPGGIFHYRMDGPNGYAMWGRFEYREIAEPERLVFINAFSDAGCNLARAPFFDGTWPLEVLITVTFSEQDGKTTVTLRSGPINATDIEQQTFVSNIESMGQGFGASFEQLRVYLAAKLTNA